MATGQEPNYTYQLGGSLPADAPSYIPRQADQELLAALLAGTYCYVLNARQMGKSSLRVRTVEQLLDAGVRCAEIELLGIGSQQITASQWYGGIIQVLISSLGLRVNRRQWLADHADLSPVQRFGTFIEEIVLVQIEQPLVFFFDEIDSVLGLSFPTDEFFGLIRNWYEKRSTQPAYRRLTVVMLGVATPSDLIQSPQSTPFNIGQAIELQGFTLAEARPLGQGLSAIVSNPEALLKEILAWTGGQPFLTQKICQLCLAQASPGNILPPATNSVPPTSHLASHQADYLAALLKTHILDNWEGQDEPEHLRTLRNRLLKNARDPLQLLKRYRQILRQGAIPIEDSFEQRELRLTGLVTRRQGQLHVFNRIYRTVFDQEWVNNQIKTLSGQAADPLPWWQVAVTGIGATLLVLLVRSLGLLQPLELFAFDQLMRARPPEPGDNRFLIITVSEADMQYQDRLGMERTDSLSDEALLTLWQKLTPYEPRVVGLDFYHDFPFSPPLAEQLAQSDRFIAVCEIGQTLEAQDPENDSISIPAPPNLPSTQVGFTDFAIDTDYRVRRHLLGMDSTEGCATSEAFNLKVALRYLAADNITLNFLSSDLVTLGDIELPKIPANAGGYRLPKADQAGYQILTNYRSRSPRHVALRDVLEGKFDNDLETWVRDRIVLIGIADAKDAHFTPMQRNPMFGVTVQAHKASQLISAALDNRPLLWWLPEWGEGLWILGWAVVGSSLAWRTQQVTYHPRLITVALLGGGTFALIGTAYGVLLFGGWLPLVPSLLATSLSICGTLVPIQRQSSSLL